MKKMLEENEWTFKPKLNHVSKNLAKTKRNTSKSVSRTENKLKSKEVVFNKLYHDSKHKIDINIESLTQKFAKNKGINFRNNVLQSCRSTKAKDFDNFRTKYVNRFNKFRKEHSKSIWNVNDSTSQKLLIPKAKKSKSGSRSRSKGVSVHDQLFNDSKIKQFNEYQEKYRLLFSKNKQGFSKYLTKKPVAKKQVIKKSKSRKITDQIKVKRLQTLFEKLDDDNDGYISSQKINILEVSNEIIDIITPLLLKIEDKALILNFRQFWECIDDFSKELNIDERNVLYGPVKNHHHEEQISFNPNINSKSNQICDSINRSTKTKRLDEMIDEKKMWKMRDFKIKESNDQKIINECTFKPKVSTYHFKSQE